MRIQPVFQLVAVAAVGALCAASADVLVNDASSGVLKGARIVMGTGLASGWAEPMAWALFVALGPASTAYFRPLTRRSAFALAFGLAAVLSILIPNG